METRNRPCNDSCPHSQFATQIECIKTKKVFQSCQNFFTQEHSIKIPCEVDKGITGVRCEKAVLVTKEDCCAPAAGLNCSIDCKEHKVITKDFFDVIIYLRILPSGILIKDLIRIKIPADKRVFLLFRAGEPGLKCMAEVFVDCQHCRLVHSKCGKEHKAICCLGIMIIGKLFSEVQLMIPTLGYCPLPEDCVTPPEFCHPICEEENHDECHPICEEENHDECNPICEEENHDECHPICEEENHDECHPIYEEENYDECHPIYEEEEEKDYLDDWLKMDVKFDEQETKIKSCNDNWSVPQENPHLPPLTRGTKDGVEVICDKVFVGRVPFPKFEVLDSYGKEKHPKENYDPTKVRYPWEKD